MSSAKIEMLMELEGKLDEARDEIDRLVDADTLKCDRIHCLLTALQFIAAGHHDPKMVASNAIDEARVANELFGWSP